MEMMPMVSSLESTNSQEEILTTKAEISEIREENERLRTRLSEVIKDYKSLQTQFGRDDPNLHMSLSLGGCTGSSHNTEDGEKEEEEEEEEVMKEHGEENIEEELGLRLGLNIGFENKTKADELMSVTEKKPEEEEEEEKKEGWVTRKILKNMRSRRGDDDDDEFPYSPIKKARVSVRTRCDGIVMNDGCQWRKYGQKVAKGNPCPRSYYRCTVAPECPVRKQVQRFVEDTSILTTTYEGKHNHPLTAAAASMAKTTSMAMNMLLSRSSRSKAGGESLAPINTTTNINGVNYTLTSNNIPHLSAISPSHPTITLDLTLPQSPSPSSPALLEQNQWSRLGLPAASWMPANTTGGYQFGSKLPSKNQIFSNKINFNYQGQTQQQPFYKSHAGLSLSSSSTPPPPPLPTPSTLTDTITVATKAIALDPNFQSALAATVASVLGAGGGGGAGEMGRRIKDIGKAAVVSNNTSVEGMKMEDRFYSLLPNYPASSTLSANSMSTQHHQKNHHHHPSIPFSNRMNTDHSQ